MIIKVKKWYFVKTLYEYGEVHVMQFVSIQGVPMNNFAPMRNCPGMQGNLHWIPG